MPETLDDILAAHAGERGALLPILHDVQHAFGWIPAGTITAVAEALNLSRAEVYGTVTFYKDFRREPPPAVHVQVCRAEACQANGCEALVDHVRRRLGCEVGSRSPDGSIGLDEVFCLGLCGNGPSALVGGRLVARLDADRFDAALDRALADA